MLDVNKCRIRLPRFLVTLVNCCLVSLVVFFIKDYEMGDTRKMVVVTMAEKLRAIKQLDSGVTTKTTA